MAIGQGRGIRVRRSSMALCWQSFRDLWFQFDTNALQFIHVDRLLAFLEVRWPVYSAFFRTGAMVKTLLQCCGAASDLEK